MSRLVCFAMSLLGIGGIALACRGDEIGTLGRFPSPPAVTVKRRADLSDEDLRKQLQAVPEAGLDQGGASVLYAGIRDGTFLTPDGKGPCPDLGPVFLRHLAKETRQADRAALPWRTGPDTEMGKEIAERLHVLSSRLRDALRMAVPPGDIRPDPGKLRPLLTGKEWATPEAVPTLTQMLQAENTPIRLLLVDMLAGIRGKEAGEALARRAAFDLSPEVRARAVGALAGRPAAEYLPTLYYALRYPWPPAADHAAEALAALKVPESVPRIARLLNEPNPAAPVKTGKGMVVGELVRVNHLSNCMVCHAPSQARADLVRGRVPMPGEEPPPAYDAETSGQFVRADITCLRQDFSVVQPVTAAGKWPGNQRYDYVLRTRPATRQELRTWQQESRAGAAAKPYPQREAMLFALREITGKDLGASYEAWAEGLPKLIPALKAEQEKK
jgi:hypothetical protein